MSWPFLAFHEVVNVKRINLLSLILSLITHTLPCTTLLWNLLDKYKSIALLKCLYLLSRSRRW